MEKFFFPKHKIKFVGWLVQIANDNEWQIILSFHESATYEFLLYNSVEVRVPENIEQHYGETVSIKNPIISEEFLAKLILNCSVLSIHDEKGMLFLIADDFHEECFSCTQAFFQKYYPVLKELDLIYVNQENANTRFTANRHFYINQNNKSST